MSILSNKRILITGATGHIGSYLVARLATKGCRQLAVARNEENLYKLKGANLAGNIGTFVCDFTKSQEVATLAQHIGGYDLLVHLAAAEIPKKSPIGDDILASVEDNVMATINVLRYFGQGVGKICLASATVVYGLPVYLPIDEGHPTEPQSYYAAGKLAAEKYVKVFSERNNCPTIILRFASVYGPGEAAQRTIPGFIKAVLKGSAPVIYGEGLDVRDYVYIDDAVEGIILALEGEISGFRIYNIASGQGHTIKGVAEMVVDLCSGTQPLIYQPSGQEALDYVFDISAVQRDLHYSPKTSLREGLRREIAWFRSAAKVER